MELYASYTGRGRKEIIEYVLRAYKQGAGKIIFEVPDGLRTKFELDFAGAKADLLKYIRRADKVRSYYLTKMVKLEKELYELDREIFDTHQNMNVGSFSGALPSTAGFAYSEYLLGSYAIGKAIEEIAGLITDKPWLTPEQAAFLANVEMFLYFVLFAVIAYSSYRFFKELRETRKEAKAELKELRGKFEKKQKYYKNLLTKYRRNLEFRKILTKMKNLLDTASVVYSTSGQKLKSSE